MAFRGGGDRSQAPFVRAGCGGTGPAPRPRLLQEAESPEAPFHVCVWPRSFLGEGDTWLRARVGDTLVSLSQRRREGGLQAFPWVPPREMTLVTNEGKEGAPPRKGRERSGREAIGENVERQGEQQGPACPGRGAAAAGASGPDGRGPDATDAPTVAGRPGHPGLCRALVPVRGPQPRAQRPGSGQRPSA